MLARRHTLHQPETISVGTLRIDRQAQTVTRQEQPVRLNPAGYTILLALAEAHPRIVTRSELTRALWGDGPPDSDALRSHLYLLRRALDRPFAQPMLVTVHGVGFRLEACA